MSTHEEIMEDFYGEIEYRSQIVGVPFKIIASDEVDRRESKKCRKYIDLRQRKRSEVKKKP
jgi:hypothetical protein